MATTIKLKNSVTTTSVPSSLVQGEVAINVTDKKVWVGNAATTPIQIAGAGTTGDAAGSNTQVQYNSSGSFAGDADFTFNGTTVTMANDASISGLTVGKGGGAVSTNTAVGVGIFQGSATGTSNSAFGYNSLFSISTGSSNTGVGRAVLGSNTTGGFNTGVGHDALANNTTASNNTAVGYQATYTNTTGYQNTAVGTQALYTNATGGQLAAFGWRALYASTADNNSAFGHNSQGSTTTGASNISMGQASLSTNTTGSFNTALGASALQLNTTASNNTAVGYQAGYSLTTGGSNVIMGYQAFDAATTGSSSTVIGNRAGGAITTGANNTIVGADAGAALTTGVSNCFIGATGARASGEVITTGSKNTIVGSYDGNFGGIDIRTASNNIVVSDGDGNPRIYITSTGNTIFNGAGIPNGTVYGGSAFQSAGDGRMQLIQATTSTGTRALQEFYNPNGNVGSINTSGSATNYVTSSDYRLKNTIAPMTGALAKVALLKPVTYKWNADGSDGEGFIAHELAEVVPQCVTGEKDAVDKDGNIKSQGIDTSFLVATLTAAIQELNAKVEAQALEIATLKGN